MNKEQKALFKQLTPLQKKVVTNVLSGMYDSNRAAYRAADGKAKTDETVDSVVSKMLSADKVRAFLDSIEHAMVDDAIMTRDEMAKRLTSFGRISLNDIIDHGEYQIGEEEGVPIYQASWKIKADATEEALRSISELTAGRDGIKIKQHSPIAAMKNLSDLMGYDKDKTINVKDVTPWSEITTKEDE